MIAAAAQLGEPERTTAIAAPWCQVVAADRCLALDLAASMKGLRFGIGRAALQGSGRPPGGEG